MFSNALKAAYSAGERCGRAFLVGLDDVPGGKPRVTVHQASDSEIPDQGPVLERACRDLGLDVRTRRRRHRWSKIEKAGSLEELIRPFRHDEILADPTGFYTRASALTAFAAALRGRMEDRVCGIYWNPEWRTLYVVFNAGRFLRAGKVRPAELGAAETAVRALVEETCGHLASGFQPCVALGLEAPEVPVVAVDVPSRRRAAGAMTWLRRMAPVPALGALFGLGVVGAAAAGGPDHAYGPGTPSAPAVSGPNGKLAIIGGHEDQDNVDSAATGRLIGSYTLPLGHRFGVQVDGMIGLNDDDGTGGIGGHLFWRDPTRGLLGATIGYAEVDRSRSNGFDKDITQFGGEAELYLDRLTLSGAAGGQSGSRIDDGFFGRADLNWYASDDLMLSGGFEYNEEREGLARFGVEYQPAWTSMHGMSIFADARFGDEGYTHVRGGLRFYFGKSRTLKDRHRYDDPISNTSDYAADSLTGDPEVVTPPPPTPPVLT